MKNIIHAALAYWLMAGLHSTEAIVSNTKGGGGGGGRSKTQTAGASNKQDSQAAQSINRDYGYGDNHLGDGGGYGGTGLGAYGGGYDDGYNSYGDSKYHHGFDHKDDHHDHHEHHHDHSYHKALAIKSLLIPLAGVALLGAAAAFVSNPILLQLGVISGTYGRRRRDTNNNPNYDIAEATARLDAQIKLGEIQLLERFMAQVPKEEMQSQEKKLLASYLTCSGLGEVGAGQGACLERLTCELHSPQGRRMPVETHVMSIVTSEILNNELIPEATKQRLSRAVELGSNEGDCRRYKCKEMDE